MASSLAALEIRGENDTGLFHAEAGRPALRAFEPAHYRGHSQVWSMAQREDGVRFFGFYGGFAEFDGTSWQTLDASFGSARVVVPGPDGKIYYSASNDLGWIDHAPDGTMRTQSILSALPPEATPAGPFAELAVFRGALHVSTTKGVVRWDGKKFDRFWPIAGDGTPRLNLVGDRLWVRRMGTQDIFELRDDEWVRVFRGSALGGKRVHLVVAAADGTPLLGASPGGLFRLEGEDRIAAWPNPASSLLEGAQLYCAKTLQDGSIAVGTYSDGLILISSDGRRARQVTMTDGLPSNLVQGLGLDRDGRLWICTFNGIATMEWPPAFTLFDRRDGLDPAMVRGLRRYENQMILGGLGGVYAVEPGGAGSIAPPRVTQIAQTYEANSDPVAHSTGRIHGGSGGLKTVRNGKAETVLKIEDNLLFLIAANDNPDRLYFSGQKGIGSALYREGRWQLEGYAASFKDIATLVQQSEDGALWTRTVTGEGWRIELSRLADGAPDWEHATVTPCSAIPGWAEGKSTEWSFASTSHGLLAFTKAGILRYDASGRRFLPDTRFDRSLTPAGHLFTLSDGPDGTWCAIFPDGRRPGGRNAMGRFVFDGDKATWIPLPDSVPQLLGALAAHEVIVDPENKGVYWLRGLSSVMRLNLPLLGVPAPPAAPLIRRLKRDSDYLALPAAGAPLRLPWGRSSLTFQVAAPLSGLKSVRFESRLVGWNDNWSTASTGSEFVFNGLAPGDYRFEVRERDAQGRTGPEASLAFHLAAPWWRTSWAYAGYAVLVLALFYLIFRTRVAALNHRRVQLEKIVEKRTAELATARDEAEAASRAKSTFLAHMSHELRTPLNGIIGYAQVLLKDEAVAGRQRERVNIVHTSGQHLLRMINEVLDFSKIEAGKIERQDAPFHLEQLLRELAVAHESAAHARGLAFTLATGSNLPRHVEGDAQKLRQVLDNLLSNAIKFTKQGGVTLRVERAREDTFTFAVIDTGVGLNAEDRARLFQPFEQARSGRPTEPGTGLGLAITQRLVRLLGGELEVQSEPGRGSTFHFTLALPEVSAPSASGRSPFALIGYRGPRRRILVVDDNAINRSLLVDLLAPLGFELSEFESAEEMLGAAEGELRADLAFLDVKLPGMDGLELAKHLHARADTRSLPIVFTSASVLTFDRKTASSLGCPDFLPKPFAEADLNELLTRLLDLDWQHAQPAASPPPPGAGDASPRLRLEQLLALADAGDVAALRQATAEALREHPEDSLLKQIETAAASYQLELARQLLRTALG